MGGRRERGKNTRIDKEQNRSMHWGRGERTGVSPTSTLDEVDAAETAGEEISVKKNLKQKETLKRVAIK